MILWATRGYSWGFRFVRDGGLREPLRIYEEAFAAVDQEAFGFRRSGKAVALRFLDPEGRKDRSGRVIPHDFVLFGDLADRVDSVDDGVKVVWPLVEAEFQQIWNSEPPRQG